jgi:hypothetical protein
MKGHVHVFLSFLTWPTLMRCKWSLPWRATPFHMLLGMWVGLDSKDVTTVPAVHPWLAMSFVLCFAQVSYHVGVPSGIQPVQAG